MLFHEDTLLGGAAPALARDLYGGVAELPLVCPHGHCDPAWFATDAPFPDPARLLIVPDHYVFRMLASQGVALEALGVPRADGGPTEGDARAIWRLLARHWFLFAGTPTRLWLHHTLQTLFGLEEPPSEANVDAQFDRIAEALSRPEFRPRALFERFGIEVLATTEGALDDLAHHRAIRASGWDGRVVTTYRPDAVCDPDAEGFAEALDALGEITGADTGRWEGYLEAHRIRRAFFRAHGATATDHGVPDAATADLPAGEAAALFARVRGGGARAGDAALFRAQMLTEMARMSAEDGMVMQIHPGVRRNHSPWVQARFGRDKGFDIPGRTDFVGGLKPLLDAVGMDPRLSVIVFTLDESAYARELAPLAGAYPALRLGPAWWFHDSPEGMRRFRETTTETAGFWNTVGFNDDTRAFPSIPARHDVARRVDCTFLADLVSDHRLREDEAFVIAAELAHGLARRAYRFDRDDHHQRTA